MTKKELTQTERDAAMYAKGYRYEIELDPPEGEPLYVKTVHEVGPLMREVYGESRIKRTRKLARPT